MSGIVSNLGDEEPKKNNQGLEVRDSHAVIQAIYRAATGKPDKLTRSFPGNFVVTRDDIEHLHQRMKQSILSYDILDDPTTTIIIDYDNDEKEQFSSYDNYIKSGTHRPELISEILIVYEFIIKPPKKQDNQTKPQRYIVNISIDSKLPVLKMDKESIENIFISSSWFYIIGHHSINVSVDYIDFMYGKVFKNVVEEWVSTIKVNKTSRLTMWCAEKLMIWPIIFKRLSFLGLGIFLWTYSLLRNGNEIQTIELVNILASVFTIFFLSTFIFEWIGVKFTNVIKSSVIPSAIVITRGDQTFYNEQIRRKENQRIGAAKNIMGAILTTALHSIAGYIAAAIKAHM